MMWYYVRDGAQTGPVSEEDAQELYRRGLIGDETLVWREGMSDWVAAGSLPFFAGLQRPQPGLPPVVPPPAIPRSAMASAEESLPVLAHVLGLLTGFLGPMVILLVAKTDMAKAHARRALNWQISLMIYIFASIFLMFIFIGFFIVIALVIMDLAFCIMAAVKAGDGECWTYPVTIPFVND